MSLIPGSICRKIASAALVDMPVDGCDLVHCRLLLQCPRMSHRRHKVEGKPVRSSCLPPGVMPAPDRTSVSTRPRFPWIALMVSLLAKI